MRRGRVVWAAVACLTLGACREPDGDLEQTVVAVVDGAPIYMEALQDYLDESLLEIEGYPAESESLDAVKSRLLDALIEERMLHAEAERLDIEVTDREVDTYLELAATGPLVESRESEERRRKARERLMVQKLQEQVLRQMAPVTDDEVAAYAVLQRDQLLPERPVELRALHLRSLKEAERIYREIRRKRMTFREAVIRHEPSPGQAVAQQVSWAGLSPEVRAALEDLEPGEVSRPVELQGSIYLFQVGSWLKEPEDLEQELRRRARQELEQLRRREGLDAFTEQLRGRTTVRIRFASLPFQYRAA